MTQIIFQHVAETWVDFHAIANQTCYAMAEHRERKFIMCCSEKEWDVAEVTDCRVRMHWFSQYTDNTTQKCQQWPEYPAIRQSEAPEQKRHMGKSYMNAHKHPHNEHLPVIVYAPEARKDVSEAGVTIKFGLTLGAFYWALQPST